ncbi:hypothetical protein BSKO_07418 [Bryopsis sp. KO-2023]|nr:hypothetical protein BSKO_07418 [Bryopsis sp. KO-2023]
MDDVNLEDLSMTEEVPASTSKFAIYDMVDDGQAKTLHDLAERGLANDIMRLVERRLDVDMNEKDRFGRSPLHWAAEVGHITTAETLIDLGGDAFSRENMGRTPVHLAARAANVEMLQSLLDHLDAQQVEELVNTQDHRGITAVFLASQK